MVLQEYNIEKPNKTNKKRKLDDCLDVSNILNVSDISLNISPFTRSTKRKLENSFIISDRPKRKQANKENNSNNTIVNRKAKGDAKKISKSPVEASTPKSMASSSPNKIIKIDPPRKTTKEKSSKVKSSVSTIPRNVYRMSRTDRKDEDCKSMLSTATSVRSRRPRLLCN